MLRTVCFAMAGYWISNDDQRVSLPSRNALSTRTSASTGVLSGYLLLCLKSWPPSRKTSRRRNKSLGEASTASLSWLPKLHGSVSATWVGYVQHSLRQPPHRLPIGLRSAGHGQKSRRKRPTREPLDHLQSHSCKDRKALLRAPRWHHQDRDASWRGRKVI